jgi:hypothetical protein
MMEMILGLALSALGVAQDPGKLPPPAPSAYVEPQDPDRPPLQAADLKSLRERNIFSPGRVHRPPTPPPQQRVPDKLTPKPPVLTGIILDVGSGAYQAVVEDRNDPKRKLLPEPRFLKAGDQVLVYTIESIESEKVVVRVGESRKELKVGESLPEAGLKAPVVSDLPPDESPSPPPSEAKPEAKSDAPADSKKSDPPAVQPPLDDAGRKKILEERMKRLGKQRKTDEEN